MGAERSGSVPERRRSGSGEPGPSAHTPRRGPESQPASHTHTHSHTPTSAPAPTHRCSALLMLSTVTAVKGVASPSLPTSAATLLISASTRWPMVMREGMAWGLMMRSGTMPSAVKGMSSCVYVMPTVPFWPCRDANLSPTCGTRTLRTRILTKRCPSAAVVSSTESTIPLSLCRRLLEQSFLE